MAESSRRGFLKRSVGIGVACTAPAALGKGTARALGNSAPRLEHVALNVPDPVAMARWYCENLSMRIVREGPPPVNMRFISDAEGQRLLELYINPPDNIPDYRSMDPLLLHIAFNVDDVDGMRKRLIAAGGSEEGDVQDTPAGDRLAFVRDPWGVVIQLAKRAEPMLP